MLVTRVIAGVAGFAAILFAFTWPDFISVPRDGLASSVIGFFTALVVIFGVYLLFFGLTGDWLPRLSKLRKRR